MNRHKKKRTVTLLIMAGFVILGVFTLWHCSSPYAATGTRWNLSAIYNPASSKIHPSFRVYHQSDDRSLLLIKLFPNELLFNQANPSGKFMSRVSVQLQVYEIVENKPVLNDSVTYWYDIAQENVGRRYLSQIPFKADLGKRYQLRIVTRDLLRHDFNLRFLDVDKTNEFSEQSFKISNQQNIPYFSNILPSGSVYKIEHKNTNYPYIYVDYYKNDVPLPSPTFATTSKEYLYSIPDSVYMIHYSPDIYFSFSYEGLYHFRFDTNQPQGLTIVNFGTNFPKVKDPEELILPLAYITTSAEYKKLLASENKKLSVDDFWLEAGGSTGRARELIRIYYNRVYFSNYYFSNTVPGWMTDRGMVYVVYGPPKNMQKTPNSETWIYYMKGASNSIEFTFTYKPTAYSVDNFVLNRSESHDWHWREAVDSWKNGKIFLSD
jgi:GWxTD domain-containing protein